MTPLSVRSKIPNSLRPCADPSECGEHSASPCDGCPIGQAISSSHEWSTFLRERIQQQYQSGAQLFQEGQPVGFIFLLMNGVVKFSVKDQRGSNRVIAVTSAGQSPCIMLNALSIERSIHTHTCEALSPCQVVCIAKPTFLWLMKQNVDVAHYVISSLGAEVELFLDRFRNETSFSGRQRLAQLLVTLDDARKTGIGHEGESSLSLSRQELASMIGVTRETVTRLLQAFSKQGLIRTADHEVHILNKDQLSTLANPSKTTS